MKAFHYRDGHMILRILAKSQPSEKNRPKRSGTWIITGVCVKGEWTRPSFPEITWGMLSKLEYLGSTAARVAPDDRAGDE